LPYILAIDIGSNKICALVARIENGSPVIVGSGVAKSQGLKKGAIVNIELAASAIKNAVDYASKQAGVETPHAIVSVSGAYITSVDSQGKASLPTKEIAVKDINRAMQTAIYHAVVAKDCEILHALPYNFKVDDQCGVQDPVGMSGSMLEMSVHIITAQKSAMENLRKTIRAAGVEIENLVFSGYASAIAVLSDDEKELGACVIDIGASTCNLVVYANNAPRANGFLPVGGAHITADLSMALHTPPYAAERVKLEYGSFYSRPSVAGDKPRAEPSVQNIEIPKIGNENETHLVSLDIVSTVIGARVEETLMILAGQLERSRLKGVLGAGVVLTGGASKHSGLADVAAYSFGSIPVRIARPKPLSGLVESLRDPVYSVALGLIRYAANESALYEFDSAGNLRYRPHKGSVEQENVQAIAESLGKLDSGGEESGTKKTNLADIITTPDIAKPGIKGRLKQCWEWLTTMF
jgi:cell division protein FtsA